MVARQRNHPIRGVRLSGTNALEGLAGERRIFGAAARFLEADLARVWQRFRVFFLQKCDQLFAHLAAQVEGLRSGAGAHQAAQLHGAFLEIGDLQGGNPSVPLVRLLKDLREFRTNDVHRGVRAEVSRVQFWNGFSMK